MAPPAAPAQVGGGGQPQRQQQQQGIGQTITEVKRMAMFWYFISKFFMSPKKPSDPSLLMSNLFQKGEPLDMWFYVSEQEKFKDFNNEVALIWHETNIPYAVWRPESTRSLSLKYYQSEAVKHNGTVYAHVFFARSALVTYLRKSKADKRKSLLGNPKESEGGETISQVVDDAAMNDDSKDDEPPEWISYWKPNVTVNLVDDFTKYPQNAVPPNIAPYLNVEPTTGNYYPTVFFDGFWLLRDKLIPINETVTELPLNLEVGSISMTKWQLFMQIDQSFQIHRSYGSMLEGEAGELKLSGCFWKGILTSWQLQWLSHYCTQCSWRSKRYPILEQKQVYGRALSKIRCCELHMSADCLPLATRQRHFVDDTSKFRSRLLH